MVVVVVLDGYIFGFALVLLLVPAAALAGVVGVGVGVGVAGVDGDGRRVHSFAVETFEPSEGEFLL